MRFSIIKNTKLWFAFSGSLMLLSVLSLAIWGLNLSIDFTGGTLMELRSSTPITYGDVKTIMEDTTTQVNTLIATPTPVETAEDSAILPPKSPVSFGDPVVIPSDDKTTLRFRPIDEYTHQVFLKNLRAKYPALEEQKYESIGPVVGSKLRRDALLSLVVAMVAIIAYIAFAFRKLPKKVKPWKFGVIAVAALVHDLLIVVGIFSFLGHFFHVEVGTLFITALLTVLGYSVNDTIVVFDRIRENLKSQSRDESLGDVADKSLIQTMSRSINTSMTVIIVLLSLFILGSEAIRWFVFALLSGTIIGTYSSVFIASPLLVLWNQKKK